MKNLFFYLYFLQKSELLSANITPVENIPEGGRIINLKDLNDSDIFFEEPEKSNFIMQCSVSFY